MSYPPDTFVEFVLSNARIQTNVCSRQRGMHGYRLNSRTVPDYNLIFVTAGKVVWTVDKRPLELSPGQLAIVPPRVEHWAKSITAKFDLLSVHLDLRLPGNRDVLEILPLPAVQRIESRSILDKYLRLAQLEFDRNNLVDARLMLASWGRLIGLELLRYSGEHKLLGYHPIDPLVGEVMEHLSKGLAASVQLKDIAKVAGYSPQHLNRLFKKNIGVTPLQYLTKLRMERAASLLSSDKFKIYAIAKKVGYDDLYYFSRIFKQYFGCSPEQYRSENASSDYPS